MLVKRGICSNSRWDQQECVSVGWGIHHCLSADVAAGAGTVFDDESLTKLYRQPLAYQAGENVGCASGGKADDDAHRSRWIILRSCNARGCGQHGGTRHQMEKLSARKCHDDAPRARTSSTGTPLIISNSRLNVRFGSKADIEAPPFDVRFTPESGHQSS